MPVAQESPREQTLKAPDTAAQIRANPDGVRKASCHSNVVSEVPWEKLYNKM